MVCSGFCFFYYIHTFCSGFFVFEGLPCFVHNCKKLNAQLIISIVFEIIGNYQRLTLKSLLGSFGVLLVFVRMYKYRHLRYNLRDFSIECKSIHFIYIKIFKKSKYFSIKVVIIIIKMINLFVGCTFSCGRTRY